MYKVGESKIQGKGIIATQDIPKGTLLGLSQVIKPVIPLIINNTLLTIKVLDTLATKKKGLLGESKLDINKGVLLLNSNSDNMKGMKFNTQLVWLDKNFKVIGSTQAKINEYYEEPKAFHFLEIHPDVKVKKGEQLQLSKDALNTTELSRMHNHSKTPNAASIRLGRHRYLYTIKPVASGEEITVDYTKQSELEQPEWLTNENKKKEGGKFYFQDGSTVDNGILNWKKRLSQSTIPREFTNVSSRYIWNNYLKPFIKGESKEGKLTKKNIERIYGKDNVDPQIDMLRVMLGLPQHHNMLVESEIRTDKDKTGRQFDFGPEYKTKMINDLKRAYKSFDGLIKVHNLTDTEEEVFDHKLVDFDKSLQGGNPQGRVYTGEATTLYPMGIHQESVKIDPITKKRYIEYRDVFDFTPEQVKETVFENASAIVADPYTVYGRIYEDEFEDPTIIKNRYSKPLLNEGTKYKQLQMKKKQGGKFYFKTGNILNILNSTIYK